MNICLSHRTALRFWRSDYACLLAGPREPFYLADTPDRPQMQLPKLLPYAPETDKLIGAEKTQQAQWGPIPQTLPELGMLELSLLSPLGGAYPCHAITANANVRSHRDHLTTHVCATPQSQQPAVWLSENLAIVSPELLFVQMAETLAFEDLVQLGFELCGYYALPMDGKGSFTERRQLTSAAKLQAFLGHATRLRGTKAAKTALRYVLDGSASPMETKLAMLLALPYARGGYSLPNPQMNGNILLGPDPIHDTRTCDLLWRNAKVIVEYDGEEGHANQAQRTRGARRYEEFVDHGYSYTVLTYGRLLDEADLDAVAAKIASHLGVRIRPSVSDFQQRKAQLRKALLE